MRVTHELRVCLVCVHLIANGEFNDGTDAAEICGQAMARKWGNLTRDIVLGTAEHRDDCELDEAGECNCEDLGFCTSRCDGCDDTTHGDRFAAAILGD